VLMLAINVRFTPKKRTLSAISGLAVRIS
jgi:hypothetical protein